MTAPKRTAETTVLQDKKRIFYEKRYIGSKKVLRKERRVGSASFGNYLAAKIILLA